MAPNNNSDLLSKIRQLDAFPKINEDFMSKTMAGGLITLVSSIFMFLLFVSELSASMPIDQVL